MSGNVRSSFRDGESGELFEVSAKVEEVDRRRVVFSLEGYVGDRLIALGTHQRITLSSIG